MKRYKGALILLAVLVLLIGMYFYLTQVAGMSAEGETGAGSGGVGAGEGAGTGTGVPGTGTPGTGTPGTDESGTGETVKLVDRVASDITALTVSYKSDSFSAQKEMPDGNSGTDSGGAASSVWRLTNRSDFKASGSKLSAAASGFCSLTSTRIVTDAGTDGTSVDASVAEASEFGFGTEDMAVVTGTFSDGSSVSVEIGIKNPVGDGYYVRKSGESVIYLCGEYSVEQLLLTELALMDTEIISYEEGEIERITLFRGGAELFSAGRKDDALWEMESPIEAALDGTSKTQLLSSIQSLSASEFTAVNVADAELAAYGLKNPRYVLTVTPNGVTGGVTDAATDGSSGGSSVTPIGLLIGNEAGSRTLAYGMIAGTNDVFTFSLSSFGWLDKPLEEFVDPFVYIVNINQLSGLSADFDTIHAEAKITTDADNSENDVFVLNGADVSKLTDDKNNSLFRAFYQSMVGVTLYDIDTDATSLGEPEITFTYRLKDSGETTVIGFVPKDDRLYYVQKNGEYSGIVVEKRVFDDPISGLRANYAALTGAMV